MSSLFSIEYSLKELSSFIKLGLKKIVVFLLTCRKKLGSVGRKIFLLFYKFLVGRVSGNTAIFFFCLILNLISFADENDTKTLT